MQVQQSWLEIDMFFASWSTQGNDLIKLQEDEQGIVKRDRAAGPELHLHSRRTLGNGCGCSKPLTERLDQGPAKIHDHANDAVAVVISASGTSGLWRGSL
ncbi:hypothetical protein AAES_80021 [Amazona aestiva]|uniref:Uncharacterized protein n=1 Tax=Amazona aestiva TaxID=12930 RepID=A0A0Q3MG30_AMAAE|nr:hypothetical protein AAES_80021 [Amazona aestiva]